MKAMRAGEVAVVVDKQRLRVVPHIQICGLIFVLDGSTSYGNVRKLIKPGPPTELGARSRDLLSSMRRSSSASTVTSKLLHSDVTCREIANNDQLARWRQYL